MKPEPGFYPGVSFDEYASWDAVNHSRLFGFKDTPAHARYFFTNEKPPTKAKDFGWLAHLAILEPERLWRECCVRPNVDGRTKAGRPIYQEFKEKTLKGGEHYGKKIITEEEADALRAITRNVREHATANEYVTGKGYNEVSIVWVDEETGELCKSRLDRVAVASTMPGVNPDIVPAGSQFMIVADVKTHGKVATLRNFERAIYDHGYATAAAMYLEGLQAVYPADDLRPFVWIVAETQPPHLVRLFTPNPELLDWGHQRWHGWLRQYHHCRETGEWPGWDAGIEEAALPPWAAKVWGAMQ